MFKLLFNNLCLDIKNNLLLRNILYLLLASSSLNVVFSQKFSPSYWQRFFCQVAHLPSNFSWITVWSNSYFGSLITEAKYSIRVPLFLCTYAAYSRNSSPCPSTILPTCFGRPSFRKLQSFYTYFRRSSILPSHRII